MTKQPWMIIICGPNGAGKSTFYEKILKDDPFFSKDAFINLDIEAARLAGEQKSVDNVMITAGTNIINTLTKKIEGHHSFIYETTSSGRTHINLIQNAKQHGFKVATIFIGLSSVQLSHLRVQERVKNGGHSVPAEDIERRFPRIMQNFPEILKVSDISVAFDNSKKSPFELIFMMDERKLFVFHKYPQWLKSALKGRRPNKNTIHITKSDFIRMSPERISQITARVITRIASTTTRD